MDASTLAPSRGTSSTSPNTDTVDEQSHTLLIQTYTDNEKAKISRDTSGLHVSTPANNRSFSIPFGVPSHSSLTATIPVSTQIVHVKLSSSLSDLRDTINSEVPEQTMIERIGQKGSEEAVYLQDVAVLWDLPGGGTGYTMLDAYNCGDVLRMIAARGWRDMLVVVYGRVGG